MSVAGAQACLEGRAGWAGPCWPSEPQAWLWAVSRASSFVPAGGAGFHLRARAFVGGGQAWQGQGGLSSPARQP